MNKNNILELILFKKDSLPKKQQTFCNYVIENYKDISLDSVSELAYKSGVGNTTVLRAVKNLGYKNFNAFKKDIHSLVINMQTPKWWDFDKKGTEAKNIEETWNEINLMQEVTLNENLSNGIEKLINIITESKTTHVFGLRTSRIAAIYFENTINQFYPKVNQLSYEPHFIMDRLFHIKKEDVVVFIALSPFTRLTYEAIKYCKELGLTTILICDDENNSMISFASLVLKTVRHENHFTLVPVISLIETITVNLGKHQKEDSKSTLDEIGKLLVDKDITMI